MIKLQPLPPAAQAPLMLKPSVQARQELPQICGIQAKRLVCFPLHHLRPRSTDVTNYVLSAMAPIVFTPEGLRRFHSVESGIREAFMQELAKAPLIKDIPIDPQLGIGTALGSSSAKVHFNAAGGLERGFGSSTCVLRAHMSSDRPADHDVLAAVETVSWLRSLVIACHSNLSMAHFIPAIQTWGPTSAMAVIF